ncbi:hypothetical protein DFJ74DRAFT_473623 [Hyaloraphidium curvatum]|nr:hypothetical protein DFJ74DRAFT_473623 [Hyaloraphidium curvatum]
MASRFVGRCLQRSPGREQQHGYGGTTPDARSRATTCLRCCVRAPCQPPSRVQNAPMEDLLAMRHAFDAAKVGLATAVTSVHDMHLAEMDLLASCASQVLDCCAQFPKFDRGLLNGLRDNLERSSSAFRLFQSCGSLLDPIIQPLPEDWRILCGDPWLAVAVEGVTSAVTLLAGMDAAEEETRMERGSCWILLALAILRFIVPMIPVDPASDASMECALLEDELVDLRARKGLADLDVLLGSKTTVGIAVSDIDVEHISNAFDAARRRAPLRPPRSVLAQMFQDLRSFGLEFLGRSPDHSRILILRSALLNFVAEGTAASAEVSVMQDMLDRVCDRLSAYSDCRDVVDPVRAHVLWLKHGLALLASAPALRRSAEERGPFRWMRFPSVQDHEPLDSGRLAEPRDFDRTLLFNTVAAYRMVAAYRGEPIALLGALHTLLGSTADICIANEARDREAEGAKDGSIYRYREDAAGDDEKVRELFPDYAVDVKDLADQDVAAGNVQSGDPTVNGTGARRSTGQPDNYWELAAVHSLAIGIASGRQGDAHLKPLVVPSEVAAFGVGLSAFSVALGDTEDPILLPASVDRDCFYGLCLAVADGAVKIGANGGLGGEPLPSLGEALGRPHNFYEDPNVAEARLALEPLVSLRTRVRDLLATWPDHAVLLDLDRICGRVASFALSAPVMKFLTGFELILRKCDDWESYASREVSIRRQMDDLSSMVIRWRKLELQSWKDLLLWEDHKCARTTSKLWPHLWTSLLGWSLSDRGEHVPEEGDVSSLVATLDQFMLSATAGEFAERLRLLGTFRTHLIELERLELRSDLRRVVQLLSNLASYYAPLASYVANQISHRRQTIEKELNDYVRIASWKDVSVFALRESAVRTHHQLFKFVKRYREVLDVPMVAMVQQYLAAGLEAPKQLPVALDQGRTEFATDSLGHDDAVIDVALSARLGSHRLPEVPRLLPKIRSVGNSVLRGLHERCASTEWDEFATDIIRTTTTFAAESKALDASNVPGRSNMKAVRKKALVDLFRHMQWLGLSARSAPNAEVEATAKVLTSQRPLFDEGLLEPVRIRMREHSGWEAADRYFFAVHSSISKLQGLLGRRSPDLTDSEASRALNFARNLFSLLLHQRNQLAVIEEQLSSMSTLSDLFRAGFRAGPDMSVLEWRAASDFALVRTAVHSLETIRSIHTQVNHLFAALPERFPKADRIRRLLTVDVEQILGSLKALLPAGGGEMQAGGLVFEDLDSLVNRAVQLIRDVGKGANLAVSEDPENASLYRSIQEHASNMEAPLLRHRSAAVEAETEDSDWTLLAARIDGLIDQILISYQASLAEVKDEEAGDDEVDQYGLAHRQLLISHALVNEWARKARLAEVKDYSATFVSYLRNLDLPATGRDSRRNVGSMLGAVRLVYIAFEDHCNRSFVELLRLHRAFCKLSHVLCQTFTGLFENGFCLPTVTETAARDEEKGQSGAGFGDGSGERDVGDQVEHEDELEGGRDEGGRDNSGGKEMQARSSEDKDDVSVSEDFEGDLGDVDEKQTEDEPRQGEADAEEQMGDVGADGPERVDEELWNAIDEQGGESGEEQNADKPDGGSAEKASPEDRLENARDDAAGGDDASLDGEAETAAARDPTLEAENEGEMREKLGSPEDDQDMRDDGEPHEDTASNEGLDGDEEMEVEGEEGQMDREEGGRDSVAGDSAEVDQEAPEPQGELPSQDLDLGMTPDEEDARSEASACQLDDEAGQSGNEDAGAQAAGESAVNLADPDTKSARSAPPSSGAGASAPNASLDEGGAADFQAKAAPHPPEQDNSNEVTSDGDAQFRDTPNPSRSLGDAKRAWKRKLQVIEREQRTQADGRNDPESEQGGSLFEHIPMDAVTGSTTQTLGAAEKEQLESSAVDERESREIGGSSNQHLDVARDVLPEDDAASTDAAAPLSSLRKDARGGSEDEAAAEEDQGASQDATRADDEQSARPRSLAVSNAKQSAFGDDAEDSKVDNAPAEPDEALRTELEATESFGDGAEHDNARRTWAQFENRTAHLSSSLAEQLRLILEPTLASQLRGDYKTGKRLNMRKIIPYIASSFKKDKIWLRRTRPNKRQYQVMIAVDDSKSMAESRSVELTYQSVAVISKALSNIEAGQLAIARFGEDVRLLHDFDSPFNTDSGASVIRRFTFQQSRTDVRFLLQQSLAIFSNARTSASAGIGKAADLWQLLIVVSDGIYEDHPAVRSLVQQAAERKVLALFVVIDNRLEKDSVLSMTNVSYSYVDGKPAIKFNRYMDTFPAEYYVVLRDIESLPSVLSSALRQFFMASASD